MKTTNLLFLRGLAVKIGRNVVEGRKGKRVEGRFLLIRWEIKRISLNGRSLRKHEVG